MVWTILRDVCLSANSITTAPLPFYVMQGEHPIPEKVIEKFASTGSEICPNVFLLSKFSKSLVYRIP